MRPFRDATLLALFLALLVAGCETDSPVDSSPPTVSITSPVNNSVVIDSVIIAVSVSDDLGTERVEFYVDSKLIGTSFAPPWRFTWYVSNLTHNSTHTIEARAFDKAGNSGGSPIVSIVVQEALWRSSEAQPFAAPVNKIILGRNGILFAHLGGEVARSMDSGKTWSAVTSTARFNNLTVDKSGNLYGGGGGVHRSTNDGSTWAHLGGDPSGVQGLALVANQWLLTVSYSGASCYPTNAGQSWEQLHGIPGYGEYLIYNEKANTAYLKTHYHGANKNLWSSTDNGASWSFVRNFSYTTNYPGFIMAIDSAGGVWTVDSDGTLFSGLGFETRNRIPGARVIAVDASGLLMAGGNGFRFSSDSGFSWVTNTSGMTDSLITAIGIGRGGMVLAGTASGRIYRSTRPLPH